MRLEVDLQQQRHGEEDGGRGAEQRGEEAVRVLEFRDVVVAAGVEGR